MVAELRSRGDGAEGAGAVSPLASPCPPPGQPTSCRVIPRLGHEPVYLPPRAEMLRQALVKSRRSALLLMTRMLEASDGVSAV